MPGEAKSVKIGNFKPNTSSLFHSKRSWLKFVCYFLFISWKQKDFILVV